MDHAMLKHFCSRQTTIPSPIASSISSGTSQTNKDDLANDLVHSEHRSNLNESDEREQSLEIDGDDERDLSSPNCSELHATTSHQQQHLRHCSASNTTTMLADQQAIAKNYIKREQQEFNQQQNDCLASEYLILQQQHKQQNPNRAHIYKEQKSLNSSNKQSCVEQQQQQQQQTSESSFDQVKHVNLFGHEIVALTINDKDRLCLAQISNTLLKDFSYNEIHNRRVALGITCVQCTPIQLEMLRRAGAMPSSSRRCGMITMREAERLCRSFLAEEQPPELPENFYFTVAHRVNYGCKGRFIPARYISSRAKCIECFYCGEFYSPNKFIFHSHKQPFATDCNPPDSPNINSWRKHIDLEWTQEHNQEIKYAWEDVKSLFNGGTRRRVSAPNVGGREQRDSIQSCGAQSATLANARATRPPPKHSVANERAGNQLKQEPEIVVDDGDANDNNDDDDDENDDNHADDDNVDQGRSGRRHNATNNEQPMKSKYALSVSERRKMPIGWPNHSRKQNNLDLADNKTTVLNQCVTGERRSSNINQIPAKRHQTTTTIAQQAAKTFAACAESASYRTPTSEQRSAHHKSPTGARGEQMLTTALSQCQQQSLLNSNEFHNESNRFEAGSQFGLHTTANPVNVAQNKHHAISTAMAYNNVQKDASAPSTASFIYNQLYSQLIESQRQQQQQQQRQTHLTAVDPQLALRHQIWSNLLANLQNNSNAMFGATTSTSPGLGLLQSTPSAFANLNLQTTRQQQQQTPINLHGSLAAHSQTSHMDTCEMPGTTTAPAVAPIESRQNFNLPMQLYSSQAVETMFGEHETLMK